MSILNNIKYCPKFILEALIIIPIAIIYNKIFDGPHMLLVGFWGLMFLYGFLWFVFRIIAASVSWGLYSFRSLLSPIIFMALIFFINFSSILFTGENLMKQPDYGLTQEELAKDCNDAKWLLEVHYEKGLTTDIDKFYISGNTESAKCQVEKIIKEYKSNKNNKYILNYFSLYYMPRKFCQEKGYDLSWSDNN
jgi:hypothetical protein